MTTTIDENSVVSDATNIDDTDSPYTTSGEDTIQVDTSSGAVTVTLASADVDNGREIRIVDTGINAGTNNITINTEGGETINPGANSSISIAIDGGYEDLWTDGANWFSSRRRERLDLSTLGSTSNRAASFLDSADANTVELVDQSSSPTSTGVIQLNGTDIEAYSGGSAKSLSDIGSVDVEDDGTITVSNATAINFSTNVSVSDDGDGTVTITSTDNDTRTDISDGGTLIVSDTSDINFGSNLSVTDDGDGTVTIAATDTDTRTDVSDGGSTVVSETTDINFNNNLTVTDDNDGTVTIDASGGGTLQDSGSDNADGGNIYQFPQVEDSLDLQSGGEISNAESVQTDKIDTSSGYSWSDETASRSFGTTYTAPSDKDIIVIVGAEASSDSTAIGLNPSVGGVTIPQSHDVVPNNKNVVTSFRVQAGADYNVTDFGDTGSFSLAKWVEYR